jgi:hypothetical protein
MREFWSKDICSWDQFVEAICPLTSATIGDVRPWLYRGQPDDYALTTTIERALLRSGIPLADATTTEFQTIREFRRRLRDPEYYRVQTDTLYCLALMQHYSAPTRLLDCTYSPFVAAAFAMESGTLDLEKDGKTKQGVRVVWCFNGHWCEEEAKRKLPAHKRVLIGRRNDDRRRDDKTFIPLYQIKTSRTTSPPKWKFIKSENPLHLNERLTAQQGAFLCPADLGSSFLANLCYKPDNVRKLRLKLDDDAAREFAQNLKDMNISFAALFPGLEGFAKSIKQPIPATKFTLFLLRKD